MTVEPPLKWTDSDGDICVMMMASAGDTHLVGPDGIVAALLANPEARMAVLVPVLKSLSVEELADLQSGFVKALHPLFSAPTAESGKDRQAFVDFAATVPAPEVTVLAGDPSSEPVPVAEVTRKHSETAIRGAVAVLREEWRSNDGAEGDSVRVVCVLTQLTALRECYERDVAALQSNLTDANLKAEGLRVDNEELRRELERRIADAMDTDAKLAESERKLGEAVRRSEALEHDLLDIAESTRGDWTSRTQEGGKAMLRVSALMDAASTEPAGVEAVWTQEELDAVEREATELHEKLGNPAPTEPEAPARLPTLMGNAPDWIRIGKAVRLKTSGQAPCIIDNYDTLHEWVSFKGGTGARFSWDDIEPYELPSEALARFRVGQRVLRKSHTQDGVFFVGVLSDNWGLIEQMRMDGAYAVRVSLNEIEPYEPADPAPPKPGGEVLTRAELVKAIRAVVSGTADFCNGKMLALAKELEREGGGKS